VDFDFIDIFLLGGLVGSVYLGYKGGAQKKVFNLLALIGSIALATQLMQPLGSFFSEALYFSEPFSFVAAFAFVVLVVTGTTIYLYYRFGRSSTPSAPGKAFGMALGALEGALVISLLLLMFRIYDFPDELSRSHSLLHKPLLNFTPRMFDGMKSYLPGAGDFRKELMNCFGEYDILETPKEGGR
jgi:uncharacterized membrane protein required for colicin V production